MATAKGKIAIIGSGLIGRNWAMIFCSVGFEVYMYDIEKSLVENALSTIKSTLEEYSTSGILRGTLGVKEQIGCIKGASSLKECIEGSMHVQECVPEDLKLKEKVFRDIDPFLSLETVVASSSSCILPSKFTESLQHRQNCLVAHPINPPYSVRLVEIVPAPWTSKSAVTKTKSLMEEIGQSPITFSKELPGFGLNRIQYAILNQCYHLVNDGILSVEDTDKLMMDGLAPRYLWNGPLATGQLNANGFEDYVKRYGSTVHSVSNLLKGTPDWTVESTSEISHQLNEMVPLEKIEEHRELRNNRLAATAKFKEEFLAKRSL